MLNYLIECFDRVGIEERKAPKVHFQRGFQRVMLSVLSQTPLTAQRGELVEIGGSFLIALL